MFDTDLSCKEDRRRDAVRAAPLFGLDYIEVSANQLTLTVFFLGKAPANIDTPNIRISGGKRITGIQATGVLLHRQKDPSLDDSMDVRVNKAGDFSTYTFTLVQLDGKGSSTGQPMQGFDPVFSEVDFTFKGSCPTGLDCLTQRQCPPPARSQPEINYLAKDYASFRQLIFDRLALIMPTWQETHEPDIGVALVELLAYVGDYLSYYQDAVATEAYLGTARQRISVRRHARLIDYAMHEGCNARAWVTLQTGSDQTFPDITQLYFITAYFGAPASHVLNSQSLANVSPASYEIFQPLLPATGQLKIYAAHSEIQFYTWGEVLCCIAPGATSATLIDQWVAPAPPAPPSGSTPAPPGTTAPPSVATSAPSPAPGTPGVAPSARPRTAPAATATPPDTSDGPPGMVRALQLKAGDVLIFEEIVGPTTGVLSDADPTHRQAVRLTKVTAAVDPLYHPYSADFGQPILEIEWSFEDALTFPLCISSKSQPACTILEPVSVARGNVVLVDHGVTTTQTLGNVPTDSTTANCPSPCHPALIQVTPGLFRPVLAQTPLTFSQPLPSGACSASVLTAQDPREALPDIALAAIPPAPAPASSASSSIPPLFTFGDISSPLALALRLKQPADIGTAYLAAQLSPSTRSSLSSWNGSSPLPGALQTALIADLTALLQAWLPVADLLESGPNDFSFVVEMDNDGYGHLRFGDGQLGRQPDAGIQFQATFRVGNGVAGNVGAEAITYLVCRNTTLSGSDILPRNPLAAAGGTAHEPMAEVKLFAPYAFEDVIERAITAADYATLAGDNARRQEDRPAWAVCAAPFVSLQQAKATLRWTGSWYEALVAIDPMNTEQASSELTREIAAYLQPYRRIGHDLMVSAAGYVPLNLALSVCVLPDYLRAQVEQDLLQVFGNGVQTNGANGFFNPNNLTFGQGIYVSQIVAAAQAVTGVASVGVTRLARYQVFPHPYRPIFGIGTGAVPALGVLTLGPFEIARLDNDPNYPEHGRLEITLRGGR
jgi:hypothetical protein